MDVYLTDFGLARDTATGSRYTRSGTTLGTPAYMSPEQARGELGALGPASDVWSLGCVLYECVAGRRAFEGDTDAAVVANVLLAEPPRLRSVRGDVPRPIEQVVRVALAKRAGARYAAGAALRDDLDQALQGERPRARVPGSRRRMAAALAACAGIAAASAALAWWPPRGEGQDPGAAGAAATEARGARLAAQAWSLRQAQPRTAARLLGEALALPDARGPAAAAWRLERGLLLWAVGDWEEARAEWSRIPTDSPEAVAARLYRGLEAFFRVETGALRADWARPDLEAVAAAGGQEGRLAHGALAAAAKDWASARDALHGAEGWEAALLRGYVEGVDSAGDREASVREYGKAIAEGIPFAWAWNNRGATRQARGDLDGAIADYDRALEANPRLAEAWNNRANARQDQGDLAGAIADYDKALEANPRHTNARYNRGSARAIQGDIAGALDDIEQTLAVAPPDWPLRANAEESLALARAALAARGGK